MSRIGSIDIIENSQNVANSTSSITVKGYCQTTGVSWRGDHRKGTYTIKQGKTVLKSGSFTKGCPQNTKTTLFEVTLTVAHDVNGNSGTISVSFDYDSGWCTGTQSKTLTKIDRKSTLSADNGILGKEMTLTVAKKASAFTHTITYKCGSASGTICTKSSSTSVPWIPPLDLAKQNTTGRTLSITFTIETFSGTTSLGTSSNTKAMTIPLTVAPKVSYVTEEENETIVELGIGDYVQQESKLKIDISIEEAYGADITSIQAKIDGKTYTDSTFTVENISSVGDVDIQITVKDARGASAIVDDTISAIAYKNPIINNLKVRRCDANGTENMRGEYGLVSFDCACSVLNGKNSVVFDVSYKKTTEKEYTHLKTINYGEIGGNSSEQSAIFPAQSASSYDVKIEAVDVLNSSADNTTLSTAFATIHWLATGLGIAFGKLAEVTDVLDIGFKTRFFGGILQPIIENGKDFDEIFDVNTYTCKNAKNANYKNCPIDTGTGVLKVESCGEEGQLRQVFIVCSKTNPLRYERYYYQSAWGAWILTNGDYVVEQGTGGIWTYRKWHSGVCECWGTQEVDPTWSTTGIFNYCNSGNIALPFAFTKVDEFNQSIKYSNYTGFVMGKMSDSWLDKVAFQLYQYNNASENTVYVSLEVKGRWK